MEISMKEKLIKIFQMDLALCSLILGVFIKEDGIWEGEMDLVNRSEQMGINT